MPQVHRNSSRIVTVGTFDGVHSGHVSVVHRMRALRKPGDRLSALTFDPHPREVLFQEVVPKLATLDERANLLLQAGVDEVIVIPFDEELASLSAESFVADVLISRIGFSTIVVGHDHRFGNRGEGDVDELRRLAKLHEFKVVLVKALFRGDIPISSSTIRSMLAESGDVQQAASLLGRPYCKAGIVVHGDGRGRSIGFPTANLKALSDKVVPRSGVYAVLASSDKFTRAPAVMNIGIRPTFGGKVLMEEVHILDWDGDLYDSRLSVEFVDRLRSEKKFDSIEALVNQLRQDVENCREALKSVS